MSTKRLTVGAFFMALMIILSSSMFSVPVPGGHFYFNTVLIFLVCLYFEPWEAGGYCGCGVIFRRSFLLPSSYVCDFSNAFDSGFCHGEFDWAW